MDTGMSLDLQPRFFRSGDNVYVHMRSQKGTSGHHEAIVLEQENGVYTLAAHVRGPDDRPTWVIVPFQFANKLGSERRAAARLVDRVVRGALCHYETTDFVADAVILDYLHVVKIGGTERPVYDIAYRTRWGWEIAKNVNPGDLHFGVYMNSTGADRPVIE